MTFAKNLAVLIGITAVASTYCFRSHSVALSATKEPKRPSGRQWVGPQALSAYAAFASCLATAFTAYVAWSQAEIMRDQRASEISERRPRPHVIFSDLPRGSSYQLGSDETKKLSDRIVSIVADKTYIKAVRADAYVLLLNVRLELDEFAYIYFPFDAINCVGTFDLTNNQIVYCEKSSSVLKLHNDAVWDVSKYLERRYFGGHYTFNFGGPCLLIKISYLDYRDMDQELYLKLTTDSNEQSSILSRIELKMIKTEEQTNEERMLEVSASEDPMKDIGRWTYIKHRIAAGINEKTGCSIPGGALDNVARIQLARKLANSDETDTFAVSGNNGSVNTRYCLRLK